MVEKGKETVAAFDKTLTNNHIQMMKVFLSYLAPEQQNGLAVYIKLSEFRYALQRARDFPNAPVFSDRSPILTPAFFQAMGSGEGNLDGVVSLLDELMPFGTSEECARIQSMKNLLTSFGRIREIMAMADLFKEMFPEGMGPFTDAGTASPGSDGPGLGGVSGMPDADAILQMLQMFQNFRPEDGS